MKHLDCSQHQHHRKNTQSFERKGRKWILLFFSLEHSIIKCTFFPHVPLISHSTSIQWSRITYNVLYWNGLFRISLILKPWQSYLCERTDTYTYRIHAHTNEWCLITHSNKFIPLKGKMHRAEQMGQRLRAHAIEGLNMVPSTSIWWLTYL